MTAADPDGLSADGVRRLQREVVRLRHELKEAVQSLPYLRQMVQFSGDLLVLVGSGARILEANGRLAEVLGLTPGEVYGQPLWRWVPNPGQAAVLCRRLDALAPGKQLRFAIDLQAAGGVVLPMELDAHRLTAAPDADPRWTLSLRDISARRDLQRSEEARAVQNELISSLRGSEARYRDLVAQLNDGLAQVDADGGILFANPSLHGILAVPIGELQGRRLQEFLPQESLEAFGPCWGAVLAGQHRRFELTLQTADGRLRRAVLEFRAGREEAGDAAASTSVAGLQVRDVTELHNAMEELSRLAFQDPLTGLANAESLRRDLERRLAKAEGGTLLVLWIDLDGFRRVNHSEGRAAGDALLRAVAAALCRWSGSGDLVGRFGGDEFLLLRELGQASADAPAEAAAETSADAAVRQLRDDFAAAAGVSLGFSGGYSLAPFDGSQADDLLEAAATALSRARSVAPGTLLRYEPAFTTELRQEMVLESRLDRALVEGGLRLAYQPQVDGAGRLVGVEALLRWQDPELGVVPPNRFVALAERSSLILTLGRWVLEQAFAQLRDWLDQGLNPPRLAVNISARQFETSSPSLAELVGLLLERHQLPPALLELEITESCILPAAGARSQMQALSALGVHLSLDDFGTGFSSLQVLNRLALNKLKIDRSFVAGLETSEASRTIVRTALAMGRGLGLSTLAEGVETLGQLQLLEQLGCDAYQGYLFSRPLEVEAFTALLEDQRLFSTPGDGSNHT
jgi:diguanylate cyclase (GGDEF)-like protein/PAS domain S-box-containing protein